MLGGRWAPAHVASRDPQAQALQMPGMRLARVVMRVAQMPLRLMGAVGYYNSKLWVMALPERRIGLHINYQA